MDIRTRLQSILFPTRLEANHSVPKGSKTPNPANLGTFRERFDQALAGHSSGMVNSAAPTRIAVERPISIPVPLTADTGATSTPVDRPPTFVPFDPPAAVEVTVNQPILVQTPVDPSLALPTPTIARMQATLVSSSTTSASPSYAADLTPAGFLPPLSPTASGGAGLGIATNDSEVQGEITLKYEQYTHPTQQGISDIGSEGRMFRSAVAQGLVPDSPEGLGTLLANLSPARPQQNPAARAFFDKWFGYPTSSVNV